MVYVGPESHTPIHPQISAASVVNPPTVKRSSPLGPACNSRVYVEGATVMVVSMNPSKGFIELPLLL